jgi:hypothetical protein
MALEGAVSLDELLTHLGIDRDAEYPQECCGRMKRFGTRDSLVDLPCINGCCVEYYCPCGALQYSAGPIGCRCEFGGPNPLPIDGAAYHRKRRRR